MAFAIRLLASNPAQGADRLSIPYGMAYPLPGKWLPTGRKLPFLPVWRPPATLTR